MLETVVMKLFENMTSCIKTKWEKNIVRNIFHEHMLTFIQPYFYATMFSWESLKWARVKYHMKICRRHKKLRSSVWKIMYKKLYKMWNILKSSSILKDMIKPINIIENIDKIIFSWLLPFFFGENHTTIFMKNNKIIEREKKLIKLSIMIS